MTRRQALRAEFARFLGEREFHRFVTAGVTSRPKYWQERAIAEFAESHPELHLYPGELEAALIVCEVHGDELIKESVQGVASEIDHYSTHEMRSAFPRANVGPIPLGLGAEAKQIDVWYCPSCRQARSDWVSGPGASHLRIEYPGRWSGSESGPEKVTSADVTKVLRKEFFPELRDLGFNIIKGRSAYRVMEHAVLLVTVRAVGRYFGSVTGFPPASFSCQLGVHYKSRKASTGAYSGLDGIPQPMRLDATCDLEHFDQSRQFRGRSMGKGEIERRDIWWIANDGSNIFDMVKDLGESFRRSGMVWFGESINS